MSKQHWRGTIVSPTGQFVGRPRPVLGLDPVACPYIHRASASLVSPVATYE